MNEALPERETPGISTDGSNPPAFKDYHGDVPLWMSDTQRWMGRIVVEELIRHPDIFDVPEFREPVGKLIREALKHDPVAKAVLDPNPPA
jgi:hypothetical protein